MKTNKLIKALNHMKVQTGSLMCPACVRWLNYREVAYQEHLRWIEEHARWKTDEGLIWEN